MTAEQGRQLRRQGWVRMADKARYPGDVLAALLAHWKVTPERLLQAGVGEEVETGVATYVRVE